MIPDGPAQFDGRTATIDLPAPVRGDADTVRLAVESCPLCGASGTERSVYLHLQVSHAKSSIARAVLAASDR
jgi:hypothetical protein